MENRITAVVSPFMVDVLDFFTRNDLEKLQITCKWINQLIKKHFKSKPLQQLENAKLEFNLDYGMQLSLSKPTMNRQFPTISWDPRKRCWIRTGAHYVRFSQTLPYLDKIVRIPKVYIWISADTNLKKGNIAKLKSLSHIWENAQVEKFIDSDIPQSFQVIFVIKIVGAKLSDGEMGEFRLQNNRTREVLQLRMVTFDEVSKYCEFDSKAKYFILERPHV
ncbi:hypothetical protein Ddc_16497 [Ditylenchus destructor]|nr:hypothetical protein Ddc_16497 [Ditylenchus destructor]